MEMSQVIFTAVLFALAVVGVIPWTPMYIQLLVPHGRNDEFHPLATQTALGILYSLIFAICIALGELTSALWRHWRKTWPMKSEVEEQLAEEIFQRWPEAFQLGSSYFMGEINKSTFTITTMDRDGCRRVIGHGIRVNNHLVTCAHVVNQPVELWLTVYSATRTRITVLYDRPINSMDWKPLPGALTDVLYAPFDVSIPLRAASVTKASRDTQVKVVSAMMPLNCSSGRIWGNEAFGMYTHNASTKPGWSGAPLMSGTQVVAIHGGAGAMNNYAYSVQYIALRLQRPEDTEEELLRAALNDFPDGEMRVRQVLDEVEVEYDGGYYRFDVDQWRDLARQPWIMDALDDPSERRRRKRNRGQYDDTDIPESAPLCPRCRHIPVRLPENAPAAGPAKGLLDDNPASLPEPEEHPAVGPTPVVAMEGPETPPVEDESQPKEGPVPTKEYEMSGNVLAPRGGATSADPVVLLRGAHQLLDQSQSSLAQQSGPTAGQTEILNGLVSHLNVTRDMVRKLDDEQKRRQSLNDSMLAQLSQQLTRLESAMSHISTLQPLEEKPGFSACSETLTPEGRPEAASLRDPPPLATSSGGRACTSLTLPPYPLYGQPSETDLRALRVTAQYMRAAQLDSVYQAVAGEWQRRRAAVLRAARTSSR